MSKWRTVRLKELMADRIDSVDPSKHPDELFDLYSIPSFDQRRPETCSGSEVGSSKQLVQPGDVLLSRIVPHIRRSWIVGRRDGRRLIASGEWIVFRSSRIDPAWLCHTLVGDVFHAKFMQTVAGVGGSLMRARSSHVANIQIPLPPPTEQRRIAAILDQADMLRTQRHDSISNIHELAESTFIELFGDPLSASQRWPKAPLGQVASVQGGLQLSSKRRACPESAPYLRVANVMRGYLNLSEVKAMGVTLAELSRTELHEGDLLVVEGHGNPNEIGRVAMWDGSISHITHQNHLIRVRPTSKKTSTFLLYYLNSHGGRQHLLRSAKTTSGLNTISTRQVKETPVPLPPIELLTRFDQLVGGFGGIKNRQATQLQQLDALFASLQARAFAGEL
jgi:type I restriction enzyme, S subunit